MIKQIKYNRSILDFRDFLSSVTSTTESFFSNNIYFHNDKISKDEILFYIEEEFKAFYIYFDKMESFGVTFGLDYDEVDKIISEKYNIEKYNVYRKLSMKIC